MHSDQRTQAQPSPPPSRFLQIRAISFTCIILLSFLWITLLCVVIFAQWDPMDHIERSIILIMLLIDTVTVIMLPILLLRPFRPWLDAARFLLLVASHCGIAAFFASKSPSFQCSSQIPDQEAVCNLIILFVIVSSWVVPVLLIGYSCGLAFLVYRLSKTEPAAVEDVEKQKAASHHSFQSQ